MLAYFGSCFVIVIAKFDKTLEIVYSQLSIHSHSSLSLRSQMKSLRLVTRGIIVYFTSSLGKYGPGEQHNKE